jgi:hypothetical protein
MSPANLRLLLLAIAKANGSSDDMADTWATVVLDAYHPVPDETAAPLPVLDEPVTPPQPSAP